MHAETHRVRYTDIRTLKYSLKNKMDYYMEKWIIGYLREKARIITHDR